MVLLLADRLPRRRDHGDLAVRPPRAADPARGGASGRKPLRIIAGLVASFSVFTLFATWILDKLGLPQDMLRNLAIAFLFVLAAMLLVPQVGADRRAAARRLLAPPPQGRRGRRLPLRRDARARLRAVRRPGARDRDGRRGEQQRRPARDPAHARVRARRRGADARDRLRRARSGGAPAPSRADGAPRLRASWSRSSRSGSSSTSTTTWRR